MRSCHSTRSCSRRYWSGHEPSKQKGRQNTGAEEHLVCAFFLHLRPERLNLSFVFNEFRLELTEEDMGTRLKEYSSVRVDRDQHTIVRISDVNLWIGGLPGTLGGAWRRDIL